MAIKSLDKPFGIEVKLDTSQIFLKSTQEEIQKELKKYKLTVAPTVDWAEIKQLETTLQQLSKTQIVNLKINESDAINSVESISKTMGKTFSDSFSKYVSKDSFDGITTSMMSVITAMKSVGGALKGTSEALTKVDALVDERGLTRVDLFAKRVNKLSSALSDLHDGAGGLAKIKSGATNLADVIDVVQTKFSEKPLIPSFDFKPDALKNQLIGSIKDIQAAIDSEPSLHLELKTIPKFKVQTKDGIDQDAVMKIPAVIDPKESLPFIKDGIASLNASLLNGGESTKLRVPVSIQNLKGELSKIPVDIEILDDPATKLREIIELLKETKKIKKIPITTQSVDSSMHNEMKAIFNVLNSLLLEVNNIKEQGLRLDKESIDNANKTIDSITEESKAYGKNISLLEEYKRIYLDAYREQEKLRDNEKTKDAFKVAELNAIKSKAVLIEYINSLTEDEADSIRKIIELEEKNIALKYQGQRENKRGSDQEYFEKLKVQADVYKKKLEELRSKLEDLGKTGKTIGSPIFNQFLETYSKFEAEYAKLASGKRTDGSTMSKAELDALSKSVKELYDDLVGLNKELKKSANEQILSAKDADKYATLYQRLISYLNKYGHEIRQNEDLYKRFLALQNKMANKSINFFDAKTDFAGLTQEARKLGLEIDTIWKKLRRTFAARGRGWLSNEGWMLISRSMRDVWRNVVEIDTAMTELRKVTNATEQQYNQFLDGAKDRAQELGATLKDVVSASADFARLGYNIEDASTLADTALIYKNVGDDVQDIETASKSIISTMQGFNIEAKNSMQIVDRFNEVANRYASSAGDIGEITKRSAASMKVAGADLDKTIALGVTANEVVQDADTVGTALKTLSMRLRSSKSDLEAAGEDTDGMADSVSKLRDEIKALSGVDIMIDDDTFKDPYEMLMEIGKVWDDLSDINRANIGELLFGKRQANIGFAILENYERAQEILETSQNSAGSAQHEQEVYLTSIQGKLDQLEATWQSMSTNLLDSDIAKGAIDALNGVLSIINSIIDGVGTIPMLIGAASAALIDFGKDAGKDCALLPQVA